MKKNKVPRRILLAFPKVTIARDATETIDITVNPEDARSGRRKDPASCALARSCVRQKIADAAVIGVGYSWLIKGEVATRYKTSVAVGREITSFDRHGDFAEGKNYKLAKVSPSSRAGAKARSRPKRKDRIYRPSRVHHTANIRVLKNYKD